MKDASGDSASDHTTLFSLLASGATAGSQGSSAVGQYSWQATGGNGTTSGDESTSASYDGGGSYTSGGEYTPTTGLVSYGAVDGTFSQNQGETTGWNFETTDAFVLPPPPHLHSPISSSGVWQAMSGTGNTVVSGRRASRIPGVARATRAGPLFVDRQREHVTERQRQRNLQLHEGFL